MIGLAVVIGEFIALGSLPTLGQGLLGFLSAFLLLAGTMVLNDIHDVEVDRINAPSRPIPSGRIRISEAYVLAILFSMLGVLSAAFLGLQTLLVALLALALMAYYNVRGKKTGLLGNAVVSFNIALPFVFGGFAVNTLRPLLFIFSTIAFLANMGREIAKGITDVSGDQTQGIRTLAILRGPKTAALTATALFVLAVLISFSTAFWDKISFWYYPIVIFADVGFLYSGYRLLRDQTPRNVRVVKTQVLLWMLFGLVGFLAGGFLHP
jgi:geranylgeranylglycerol-phosphate geranylgeranyltransferase